MKVADSATATSSRHETQCSSYTPLPFSHPSRCLKVRRVFATSRILCPALWSRPLSINTSSQQPPTSSAGEYSLVSSLQVEQVLMLLELCPNTRSTAVSRRFSSLFANLITKRLGFSGNAFSFSFHDSNVQGCGWSRFSDACEGQPVEQIGTKSDAICPDMLSNRFFFLL